jgi:FkbM family methyltransferase
VPSRCLFLADGYTASVTKLHELVLLVRSLRYKQARVQYVLERALRSARDQRQVVTVKLPGFAHPIFLRGSDYFTFHQIFTDKHYQHGLAIDPSFIIDAGANVGFAAIYFALEYPKAQIFSIEPDEENFDILLKNTTYYPNVRCFRGALWPTESPVEIANADATNPAAYTVRPAGPGAHHALSSFTPLALLRAAGREQIDVFKIDIEGAELELFSFGWQQWITKTGLIMVELHDSLRPGCGEAFFRSICHQRFSYFQRSETSIVQFQRADPGQ